MLKIQMAGILSRIIFFLGVASLFQISNKDATVILPERSKPFEIPLRSLTMRPAGHGIFNFSPNSMLFALLMALPGHGRFNFSPNPMLLALVMWPAGAWEIQIIFKSYAHLAPHGAARACDFQFFYISHAPCARYVAGQCMGDSIFLQIPCPSHS